MISNLIYFLTAPNNMLYITISCLLCFTEAYLDFKLFTYILRLSITNKQKYTYIFLSGAIYSLSNYILLKPYSYIINLIAFAVTLRIMFKQSIKHIFIALIHVYFTIFLSTYLAEITLRFIFNTSLNDILNVPLYYLLSSAYIYFLFYIIYILNKRKIQIAKLFKLSLNTTIILNLILGIITIFIQSYVFFIYRNRFPSELIIITTISLLMYFIISMYSLIRTNKLEQTTQDLETEKLYNKTLSLLHDNIRCFKHDFNNIIQAIGGYISLNDMEGLNEYYKNLLEDCKQTNNLNILNPQTINNPSIYSLLTNKYYLASEKGIKMTFNIFLDFSNINFNIYQFTRILGILLDNAIEAAQETEEKRIEIEFRSDKKKQLFIIKNSCKDNNISTVKIFEKGYSTKQNNSGIGLWKVHNILSKNTNIDLFTTVQDNEFKQQLEVFY